MDYNKDAKNGGVNGNRTRSSGAFKTDVDITGLPTSRKKPLQAWTGDDEVIGNGGLEQEVGNGRNWDQFAANERLTGGKTDYHEDIYTTKLDRTGSDYRAREQRAAQLEREILKGDNRNLANNAHMAEERGVVDDSGLDEEDRYGAVIRNPDAYVPPGARKTALNRLTPSQSSTPSPSGSERSLPKLSSVLPVRANPSPVVSPRASPAMPPVHHNFRQFVTDEKERLAQKKQVIIKNAEKKEQDSRLASLLEFSQNFKLKGPIPADLAEIVGKDTKKKPINPETFVDPAIISKEVRRAPPAAVVKPVTRASVSTLIAEIPPFNPSRNKVIVPATVIPIIPVPAPKALEATAPTTKLKINANAPAFVFRPGVSSFTPSISPAPSSVSSPVRKVGEIPSNPFFGSTPIKKGSSSMHVKEDFSPFRNGVIPEPASIIPAFAFTGRPYRAAYSPTPPPPQLLDDGHQGPPQGYPMYQQPQYPPNFRYQQPPHQLHHLPPQQQQNNQFQYPPPMAFSPGMQGPPFNPQQQQQQQQIRFGQFPPNGGPLPNGFDARGAP